MGAWIETQNICLKQNILLVAPYVGAWIETLCFNPWKKVDVSHPTWVRGLKPSPVPSPDPSPESHPTWVRGLKLNLSCALVCPCIVAPYVGAWIETSMIIKDN